MAKFPYIVIPGKDKDIYLPWISVSLDYPKTHKVTLPVWALIDSGADSCLCCLEIGQWLGIKFKKQPQKVFTTANGEQFSGFKERIKMFFSGKKYFCDFYFSKSIPVKSPIILGQNGFFDQPSLHDRWPSRSNLVAPPYFSPLAFSREKEYYRFVCQKLLYQDQKRRK